MNFEDSKVRGALKSKMTRSRLELRRGIKKQEHSVEYMSVHNEFNKTPFTGHKKTLEDSIVALRLLNCVPNSSLCKFDSKKDRSIRR